MDNTNSATIIIGVDTHKSTHVAVAINTLGARLAALSIPANTKGYQELESWSRALGKVEAFGIEGTGSYGAGLSRSLLFLGHKVIEVTRPKGVSETLCMVLSPRGWNGSFVEPLRVEDSELVSCGNPFSDAASGLLEISDGQID